MQSKNNHILILFPPKLTGLNISKRFIEKGYRVSVIVFLKDIDIFKPLTLEYNEGFKVYVIKELSVDLSDEIREMTNTINILLNFIGSELLSLRIGGKNEKWEIDLNASINLRFAFLDNLVKIWDRSHKVFWLNVLYGKMSSDSGVTSFCPARYVLSGLENLLKMNTSFENTYIQSVCLTYLKHTMKTSKLPHCANCEAESASAELKTDGSIEDSLEFLVKKSINKLKEV